MLAGWFAHVAEARPSHRHERLWDWFDALTPGARPKARVEVWPRGGAKSSTAELGCVRVCERLTRRFGLYVCETQEQADKHVQSIANLMETRGIERAVNVYGASRGWRRNELRTANGFNIAAYGLDTAARGVKLDQYRPDLIVFDDVDRQDDSTRTIEKKVNAITTAILPADAPDCAILFVQNLIHEESILSQLVDGRADFLHDRDVPEPEPAIRGLETETYTREDGARLYRITAGEATWEGQSKETCERQINDWGLRAFLREAQHEVKGALGYVFNVEKINYCEPDEVPRLVRECRAWDLAATEGGGDWTVGARMGIAENGNIYVRCVRRGQWASDRVRSMIGQTAEEDGPDVILRLPQDPGQAGKDQSDQFRGYYSQYRPIILPVTGDKTTRAAGFAEDVNKGNVWFVRGEWNRPVREVLRKFREDERDQLDDDVDALADAYNQVRRRREFQGAVA